MQIDKKIVSIVETIEDCQSVLLFAKRKKIKIELIALSLETKEYLSGLENINYQFIWDVIDMDVLLEKSFSKSELFSFNWIEKFNFCEKSFYERSIQHRLHIEFLHHAVASKYLLEALLILFIKNKWEYLVPPIKNIVLSPFISNTQKKIKYNSLFKLLSVEIFKKENISIRYYSLSKYYFSKIVLPVIVFSKIIYIFLIDIKKIILSKIFFQKNIDKLLDKSDKSIDLYISGWGREISRMLSIEKFSKINDISIFHSVWRKNKLKKIDQNILINNNVKFTYIKEYISKGITYGPELWFLGKNVIINYYGFIKNILLNRYKFVIKNKKNSKDFLNLFDFSSFNYSFLYNIFFGYRIAFITKFLTTKILTTKSPKFFLGSDSGGVSSRSELLVAKNLGITTFSTPHGYQTYKPSYSNYDFIAEHILTHGEIFKSILINNRINENRIFSIGTSHIKDNFKDIYKKNKINLVIGTRSRGGLWSNISSCHDKYDKELKILVKKLLDEDSRFNIVIKSHPNGDYGKYYELFVSNIKNNRVKHISKGWRVDKFNENCDILICLGESPSFLPAAMYLSIPVVFIDSTMSLAQKKLDYRYKNVAIFEYSATEAVKKISLIIKDKEFRNNSINKQQKFAKSFLSSNEPESKLASLCINKKYGK